MIVPAPGVLDTGKLKDRINCSGQGIIFDFNLPALGDSGEAAFVAFPENRKTERFSIVGPEMEAELGLKDIVGVSTQDHEDSVGGEGCFEGRGDLGCFPRHSLDLRGIASHLAGDGQTDSGKDLLVGADHAFFRFIHGQGRGAHGSSVVEGCKPPAISTFGWPNLAQDLGERRLGHRDETLPLVQHGAEDRTSAAGKGDDEDQLDLAERPDFARGKRAHEKKGLQQSFGQFGTWPSPQGDEEGRDAM